MADAELPDELFEPLASRIAAVSGIRVPISKRWLLSARVAERMRDSDAPTIRTYVRTLLDERGGAELGRLVEALRVGETQFYRHRGQLRAIQRVALPEIVARRERDGERVVRVWSAGCASGEEAYTLAMMLEDVLPIAEGWRHDVLATDLSEAALDVARLGVYPASAANGVPEEIAAWALLREDDRVRVTPRARAAVRFERRNLLESVYPRDFDLVLCRNVLIYFGRATQRDVLTRLSRSVLPGGYLALGYAERLDSGDGALLPLRTDDGVIYRRADDGPVDPAPLPSRQSPAAAPAPTVRSGRAAEVRRAAPRPGPAGSPRRRPGPGPAIPPSSGRGTPDPLPGLEGTLEGAAGAEEARSIVAPLLELDRPVLDLRRLHFADERTARVLSRAAAVVADHGDTLRLVAIAPGTLRFLRRHRVVPPAEVVAAPPGEEPT